MANNLFMHSHFVCTQFAHRHRMNAADIEPPNKSDKKKQCIKFVATAFNNRVSIFYVIYSPFFVPRFTIHSTCAQHTTHYRTHNRRDESLTMYTRPQNVSTKPHYTTKCIKIMSVVLSTPTLLFAHSFVRFFPPSSMANNFRTMQNTYQKCKHLNK